MHLSSTPVVDVGRASSARRQGLKHPWGSAQGPLAELEPWTKPFAASFQGSLDSPSMLILLLEARIATASVRRVGSIIASASCCESFDLD